MVFSAPYIYSNGGSSGSAGELLLGAIILIGILAYNFYMIDKIKSGK